MELTFDGMVAVVTGGSRGIVCLELIVICRLSCAFWLALWLLAARIAGIESTNHLSCSLR